MGWTGIYLDKDSFNARSFFSQEFGSNTEILQMAKYGSTYYFKLRTTPKNGDKPLTYALVALTSWRDGQFCYKDMDETCGPCEVKGCPLSILEGLDPPEGYAKSWRDRVREWHNEKKKQNDIKIGDTIVFDQPIKFSDGFVGTRFVKEKWTRGTVYRSLENNTCYRISKGSFSSRTYTRIA